VYSLYKKFHDEDHGQEVRLPYRFTLMIYIFGLLFWSDLAEVALKGKVD